MATESELNSYKTGIYKVTKGKYIDAAIFLIDVSQPDESEFTYFTIYNPDSTDSHEIASDEWLVIVIEDGLVWHSDIPDDMKDEIMKGPFSNLADL